MDLKVGDKVDLLVVRNTGIGFTVLVDGAYEGLLYKNELFQKIEEVQILLGYFKKIRDDEKTAQNTAPENPTYHPKKPTKWQLPSAKYGGVQIHANTDSLTNKHPTSSHHHRPPTTRVLHDKTA